MPPQQNKHTPDRSTIVEQLRKSTKEHINNILSQQTKREFTVRNHPRTVTIENIPATQNSLCLEKIEQELSNNHFEYESKITGDTARVTVTKPKTEHELVQPWHEVKSKHIYQDHVDLVNLLNPTDDLSEFSILFETSKGRDIAPLRIDKNNLWVRNEKYNQYNHIVGISGNQIIYCTLESTNFNTIHKEVLEDKIMDSINSNRENDIIAYV